jgi:hypothetical protein
MEFTTDHRTLLILILGLPTAYDTLIQIWNIIPDGITAEKALRMLRTEDKRMINREYNIVGFLVRGPHIREVKRKARGELTQGENSKRPSSWPTCPKCQRQHSEVYWADMTYNICRRKGHPDYRYHDREPQPQSSAILAIQDTKGGIRGFTPAFDFD